jgi:hypothetical protein
VQAEEAGEGLVAVLAATDEDGLGVGTDDGGATGDVGGDLFITLDLVVPVEYIAV